MSREAPDCGRRGARVGPGLSGRGGAAGLCFLGRDVRAWDRRRQPPWR